MRTTQFYGFPNGYNDLFYNIEEECPHGCERKKYLKYKSRDTEEKITGMFGEHVHTCREYIDINLRVIYRETEQCAPWSSGPCIFMKIVDGQDNNVLAWTKEEINNLLWGESC